jgi:hypothetical protein
METLGILSKRPLSLEVIEGTLSKDWAVESSAGGTLVVHANQSRAYLYLDDGSQEAAAYRMLIDYSDVELAKKIVEKIASDPSLTVDNDFGTILPGDQFVSRCKSEASWDWRL